MSQRALLVAVRDAIKSEFSLNSDQCEIGFDGHPKPVCGELFVAIHEGGESSSEQGDYDLSEAFAVNVTVTRRTPYAPQDRWGTEILTKADGLSDLCRKIRNLVHFSYPIMNSANILIPEDADKFYHPLLWVNTTPPMEKGPEWFGAARDQYEEGMLINTGVTKTVYFGKARRMQHVEQQQ